jgi:hypothetical protein
MEAARLRDELFAFEKLLKEKWFCFGDKKIDSCFYLKMQ